MPWSSWTSRSIWAILLATARRTNSDRGAEGALLLDGGVLDPRGDVLLLGTEKTALA
ncbi:MAG: hypothetical protein RBG13Loki_4201 [Promethearchaeota archaeon CR_4]|nr:MAG: hypothetical protein RBG13Loki_4201 [Candidatus Lokiarchaeota archaeon CR_4]